MAHDTCPTCGRIPIGIHQREPAERFYDNFTISNDDCWVWQPAASNAGYGIFTPAPSVRILAHRYSFALHNGHLDESLLVCHSCDNRRCVNPAHLRLGTPLDNARDRVERGRATWAGVPQKLNEVGVRAIRLASSVGVARTVLAEQFDVSTTTISQVVNRQTWKHVA